MRLTKTLYVILPGLLAGAGVAQAQPSDARIKKDISGPGVLSFKFTGPGKRVWSSTNLQYLWERNVVVVRKAGIKEYPNAKLEVGGIASYTILGNSYPFRRFYVTYNRYYGIPAPKPAEVLSLVKKDMPRLLSGRYGNIVGDIQPIALAANPQWNWHTPNSVSVLVTTGYSTKSFYTELEKKRAVIEVRLYRDKIKAPWNRFIAVNTNETSLGKTTYDADDLRAMKTLNIVDAERGAAERVKNLPDVEIPAFKTDLELFAFVNDTLRSGDARKGEAVLRRLLGPGFFETGSDVLLNGQGQTVLDEVLKNAFKSKGKYADQYGDDLSVRHYQPNMLEFWNADGRHFSRIEALQAGGTWQNGVKVGQSFRIKDISIFTVNDAEEIARLNSMPPATRFAPPNGATMFSQLGREVVAEQKAAEQAKVIEAITWTPFTSPKARLKASFPGTPTETEGKMNDKYPMWTVEAIHPQVLCRAVAIHYPAKLNRMQAQTVVDSALQNLAQANDVTIKSRSDLVEGTFGRLAQMESKDKSIKARVFVRDDVLYQLILSASPTTMNTLNERDFFGSFEALD